MFLENSLNVVRMAATSGHRMRMKDWLYYLLDNEDIPGLSWENRHQNVFKIEWKHGSRHGYILEKDAVVFKKWAEYTGY